MRCWITGVMPLWWPLGLFVVASWTFSSVDWYLGRFHGAEVRAAAQLDDFAVGAVMLAGACYAALRVLGCHPLYNAAYARWLARTPWTARKPLPLGPVRLVPQDAEVVGALVLLAWITNPSLSLLAVPWAFSAAYVLLNLFTFWPTGQRLFTFAVAFAAGLVVRLAGDPFWSAALMGVVLLIIDVGLRRSLAAFPWHVRHEELWWSGRRLEEVRSGLGWPYDQLRPPQEGPVVVSRMHGVLWSALLGWWAYAFLAVVMDHAEIDGREPVLSRTLYGSAVWVALIFAGWRIAIYCRNHWSPISLWGRVRTGQLLVPGYDRVLIAPLVTVLVGVATPVLMMLLDIAPPFGAPLTVCLALMAALTLGPGVHEWRLTGSHRIVPRTRNHAQYVRL